MTNYKDFEEQVKSFLFREWSINLEEKEVKIGDITKKFDLVSEDSEYVGDVKYYGSSPILGRKRNGGTVNSAKIRLINLKF